MNVTVFIVLAPLAAAAEVILASVNPDSLSLEDREKLDLLASGA
jgi:hypothetical protein